MWENKNQEFKKIIKLLRVAELRNNILQMIVIL